MMRLLSFTFPAFVIFAGSAAAGAAGAGNLLQGLVEAAVGGVLAGPAAWLGQGLKKIGVPGDRVPLTTTAMTSLAMLGIAKAGGLGDDWTISLVRIGSQAGMTSGFAHDAGWTKPRQWAKDVGEATGASQVVDKVRGKGEK